MIIILSSPRLSAHRKQETVLSKKGMKQEEANSLQPAYRIQVTHVKAYHNRANTLQFHAADSADSCAWATV
jgi:hypothetical protein